MRVGRCVVVVTAASLLSACSSAPQEIQLPPATAVATTPSVDPAFVVASTILTGFELGESPEDWQIGDQILVGIRVTKPKENDAGVVEMTETIRFVHIELLEYMNPTPAISFKASPAGRPVYQFDSALYYTRLSLYDEKAHRLDVAVGRFASKLLGHGLFDGASPAADRQRLPNGNMDFSGVSDAEAEHELLGWLSLYAFTMSINKKGMFSSLMKDVVARPSLVAMIFNPSLSLALGKNEEFGRQAWAPLGGRSVEAVSIPLTCSISDKLGAVARVHAARPVAPIGLSGGVVSIVGNNADRPDVRFEVRLLASKRGTKGQKFELVLEDPPP